VGGRVGWLDRDGHVQINKAAARGCVWSSRSLLFFIHLHTTTTTMHATVCTSKIRTHQRQVPADLGVLEPTAEEEGRGVQRPARGDDGLLAPHDELVGGAAALPVLTLALVLPPQTKTKVRGKGKVGKFNDPTLCKAPPPPPHHHHHSHQSDQPPPPNIFQLFFLKKKVSPTHLHDRGDDADGLPRLGAQDLVDVRAGHQAELCRPLCVLEEGREGGLLGCDWGELEGG
jgi:hypothetical protein